MVYPVKMLIAGLSELAEKMDPSLGGRAGLSEAFLEACATESATHASGSERH